MLLKKFWQWREPVRRAWQAGAQTAKPAQVAAETKAQPKETIGETEAVVRAMSKSIYDNIAISRVTNYVNVRAQASTDSEVVGKIYNNCAATILDTVDGEGANGTIPVGFP